MRGRRRGPSVHPKLPSRKRKDVYITREEAQADIAVVCK